METTDSECRGTTGRDIMTEMEMEAGGLCEHPAQQTNGVMKDTSNLTGPMIIDRVEENAVGEGKGSVLPNSSKSKTWASIVDEGSSVSSPNLAPLQKTEVQGKKRLTISQEAYLTMCHPFRFCAIATLAGGAGKGRLDYSFIFSSLRKLWPTIPGIKFTSVGRGVRRREEDFSSGTNLNTASVGVSLRCFDGGLPLNVRRREEDFSSGTNLNTASVRGWK